MKLTKELIASVSDSIMGGLSNKEAAAVNDIDNSTFYRWLSKAKETAGKPASKLSKHQVLCRLFKETIDKARFERKKRWIQKLDECSSPAGIIFLLKMTYPAEFNKQPVLIPNFKKLEEFMASEYTQSEIEAIRKAVRAAENRRQSEVVFDEESLFGDMEEIDEQT